mgnify:CR=1 FL=1
MAKLPLRAAASAAGRRRRCPRGRRRRSARRRARWRSCRRRCLMAARLRTPRAAASAVRSADARRQWSHDRRRQGLFAAEDGRARCFWCAASPAYRALSRQRMGLSGRRRPAPVREALPRGLPGGPELADDPQQARGLPQRLRRLRRRAGRPLRRPRRRPGCSATPASCAIAARSSRRSTTPAGCSSCARSSARSPPTPGASSRHRARGRSADDAGGAEEARQLGRIGGDVEGPEEARLELRRPDHGLRVHAGDGPGERPSRRLPRARARFAGAAADRPAAASPSSEKT